MSEDPDRAAEEALKAAYRRDNRFILAAIGIPLLILLGLALVFG